MGRGNPHPHRYKYGKIDRPIDLPILIKLQERVPHVDLHGFSVEFIQALIALFYWTGLRKSEVLGRRAIKYQTKKGERIGKPHPGLLWDDIRLVNERLYVYSIDENVLKHGTRKSPLILNLSLPYVDLIRKQWEKTKPHERVFPIPYITFWRICKAIDPKFTVHFFRHNRVTKFCANPKLSLAQICSWTGLSPQTVSEYMMRVGRFTIEVGNIMAEEEGV